MPQKQQPPQWPLTKHVLCATGLGLRALGIHSQLLLTESLESGWNHSRPAVRKRTGSLSWEGTRITGAGPALAAPDGRRSTRASRAASRHVRVHCFLTLLPACGAQDASWAPSSGGPSCPGVQWARGKPASSMVKWDESEAGADRLAEAMPAFRTRTFLELRKRQWRSKKQNKTRNPILPVSQHCWSTNYVHRK